MAIRRVSTYANPSACLELRIGYRDFPEAPVRRPSAESRHPWMGRHQGIKLTSGFTLSTRKP